MFVLPKPNYELWNGAEVEFANDTNVTIDLYSNLFAEICSLAKHPDSKITAVGGYRYVVYKPGFVLHHALVGFAGCDVSVLNDTPLRSAPNFVVDFIHTHFDPVSDERLTVLSQAGVDYYWKVHVYEDLVEVFAASAAGLELVLMLNVHCRAPLPPFDWNAINLKTLLYPRQMRKHIQLPRPD